MYGIEFGGYPAVPDYLAGYPVIRQEKAGYPVISEKACRIIRPDIWHPAKKTDPAQPYGIHLSLVSCNKKCKKVLALMFFFKYTYISVD